MSMAREKNTTRAEGEGGDFIESGAANPLHYRFGMPVTLLLDFLV
jgi:hypothetical protein